MPLSPLTPASARYHVRRRGGTILGPFEPAVLAAMLADERLDGSEDISLDREIWRSIQTLVLPTAAPSLSPSGAAVGGTPPGVLDLGSDLGEVDSEVSLELVERKPAPSRAHPPGAALSAADRATQPTGVQSPPVAQRSASPGREAAGAGSMPLEPHDEVVQVAEEATRPVRLDEPAQAPSVDTRVRKRTLTASREGSSAAASGSRWRPSRRSMIWAGAIVATAVAIAASIALDLPDRVRGEPSQSATLGPTERELAQDHFQAFSEGARRLEEAAGTRRHVPVTRDAAAALLASSVVIHGGERGRIAHAEALLEEGRTRPSAKPRVSHTRALAWVALAKGRWKEAEDLAAEGPPELTQADRAVILGWAALGREDATRAATAFQVAVTADPAAFPSRVAARYALARAREAEVSTEAERAFRAVLQEAPSHFGAAMGLARVSRLSEPNRLKLIETVIAGQARDASRVELAEAYALASRVAVGLGLGDKAAATLRRSHDVDPTGVAAAVLEGDVLLAEGRTDEAIARYRLSLAAPVSAARTTWFRFARVAALVESARSGEAAKVLAELDRRLPGDARIAFWRGRAAERARPADALAAEQAYREALTRDPRFLPASLQLARLLLDQHRSPDGVAVLRRAEKEGAAAAALRLALGQALLASGNSDEAARTFRQAITADPKSSTAHLGLAAALESGGDLEGARVALAALGTRSDIPGLGARVAAVFLKLGRKDQALAAYRQEITSGTATPATKVAAARVALELGQKEAARSLAQAAVDEDPRTPGALLALADVRRADGDPGRALSELRRALVVDGSAQVQLEYGRALAALGRAEDALSALSLADEIPEAAVERGRILLRRGDLEAAVKELSNATERLPSNAEAFLLLGQAEDRLGHVTRAESDWKTAVRLAPRSAESRYRLGRLQMDEGQTQAALINLRAATDHLPATAASDQTLPIASDWRPDFYFQLAFAEVRKGTSDRALAAFKRYLQLAAPDAPARAEVLRQVQQLAPPRAAAPSP